MRVAGSHAGRSVDIKGALGFFCLDDPSGRCICDDHDVWRLTISI